MMAPASAAFSYPSRIHPLWIPVFAVAYYLAGLFAVCFTATDGVAHIWPAAGVGLTALYLCGLRAFPAILIPDFFIALSTGQPWETAVIWSTGNMLALALSALILRRTVPRDTFHTTSTTMARFAIFGPTAASVLSICAGWVGATLATRPPLPNLGHMLWGWFLADFAGIVLIMPLVMAWTTVRPRPALRILKGESLALCLLIAGLAWAIFGTRLGGSYHQYPLGFALFPFFIWSAFRLDIRSLTLILAAVGTYCVAMTMVGLGPFAHLPQPHALHVVQLFMAGGSGATLLIYAILHERHAAEAALSDSRDALQRAYVELEDRVSERTAELRQALAELRAAGDVYRNIFQHAVDGIFQTDGAGRLTRANASFASIMGYSSPQEVLDHAGTINAIMASPDEDSARLFSQLVARGSAEEFDFTGVRADGSDVWLAMSIRATKDDDGRIISLDGILRDISERKRCEQALAQRAMHDELTGIANRYSFHETFAHMIAHARRRRSGLALLYVDLDDFKLINDTHGHLAGDTVLVEAVRRMTSRLRQSDLLARLGGDEFAILLPDTTSREQAESVASDIRDVLAAPFDLTHTTVTTSASIGQALYPDDGATTEDLLKSADAAMYSTKEAAKTQSSNTSDENEQ